MTLSHAIKQKPNLSESAINNLRAILKTKIERAQKNISFEETEKEIHAAFIEAERLVLSEILTQYDIDLPSVIFDGKEYRQVLRCEQTYTTVVGPVRVEPSFICISLDLI